MPMMVLAMRKRLIIISLFICLFLVVGPSTNQMYSPSSSSSSSNNTATATSHPDEFKCSLNHIFKPNLYKKKTSTANKNTNPLYYYKTTHEGEFPNKVYGLFLCVFGISLRSCRNCLRDAIVIIKQQCHGAKEAILWYDQCLVRYSYRSFFSTLETSPNRSTAASNTDLYVGEPANFTKILYQTFLEMIQMATFDAFNKQAIKASNISGSNIVLALHTFAQCIPNLSTEDCLVCLNIAVSIIPSCDFQGKKYGSILIPSCYISYELYQFYRLIRGGAPSTPTSPSAHDRDEDRRFIRVKAPPPTPNSPSAHDDVEDCPLIPAGAPTPNSPSAHENDVDGRFIRGGAPPAPNSPSAHDDDVDGRFIRDRAPPVGAPTSPSAHDNDVDSRLIRGGALPAPNSPSAHDDNVGGRFNQLTPAEAPPTPNSPSAHDDDGQLIRVGAPPTPTSLSAHDYDQDCRLIPGGAPPSTPISPSAHDDDEVRRLIQVGATPTPTSPAHHDENHQIFRAGAGAPNSSTRDKDIGASTTSHNSKRRSFPWIIFLPIGILIPLLTLLLITYLFCRRERAVPAAGNNQELQHREGLDDQELQQVREGLDDQELQQVREGLGDFGGQLNNCQEFSYATVCEATQNFNSENKLGQGGFGPVYKGTLAGKEIAVKRLESTSPFGQGELEFVNEINLITGLQHNNLVQLLGYCSEGAERLLIYEFMPNKSLDFHLFDSANRPAPLDWKTRRKIIKGIAKGLVYLHEDSRLKIIHRDIKTSNVLLDQEMNPKISDFGSARLLKDNQSEANTTRIVGTRGYMALEYCTGGVISSKSDIYSFGVVLLEIISGKKNCSLDLGLPGYTWELWEKGTPLELMDEVVAQSCDDTTEVLRCIHIGLLCVQTIAEERPSMSSVLRMLENESITSEPTKPQFVGSISDLQEASQYLTCRHLNSPVLVCAVNQLN